MLNIVVLFFINFLSLHLSIPEFKKKATCISSASKNKNDSWMTSGCVTGENLQVTLNGLFLKKLSLGLQLIIIVIRLACQAVRPCVLSQRDLLLS